jgi:hypothetical protein
MSKKKTFGRNTFAVAAENAVYDDDFVRTSRMCQRFVRQVRQSLTGERYNRFDKSTAHLTAKALEKSVYIVESVHGSVPGDFFYWYGTVDQPSGHAAIRVYGNRIAENSFVHVGRGNDGAKGFRKLSEIRAPDLIVRYPPV